MAIVKVNVAAQMEDIRERIGNLPTLGYPGMQYEMFVFANERIEKKLVDAFRKCVGADSRVQICRAAFDQHHDCVRIGA